MADLPPIQPITRTRRIAALIAALLALAATDAAARDCRDMGPGKQYTLKQWLAAAPAALVRAVAR